MDSTSDSIQESVDGMAPRVPEPASNPMPSGRVTFLFTDLEGSTRQWEAEPELMHQAVERHDEIAVGSIARWNGSVFSTAGDSFAAAFHQVTDAIGAASELQSALSAELWPAPIVIKARMAIHIGVANERGGDFFGPVVNRTARLMATGHGGQLLLSDHARAEVPDADLIDLGVHYLKDLSAPERVWQVRHDGLNNEFPPLRSLDRRLTNLPTQVDGFVGRTREISEVLELLGSHRLVTLRGLGGIGKTRLSLQIAAEAAGQLVDSVRFVALSPVSDAASVPFHVVKNLGLSPTSGQSATETIATSIGSSSSLIVFDNCEHIDQAASELITELLGACANLRVVATSRVALGVSGERVYAIEPLPTGTLDSPAEQMFIARAQAANASIDLSGEREAVLSRICERLDGIPLAIELAAARVRSMSPEEIERHLDERFRLLRSSKGFDERHRVLYDTLEWSYLKLDPDLQTLLRRLSVFAGAFTAADALAVAGSTDDDLFTISDQLDELVDNSLVAVDVSADSAQYRLLDTMREFGEKALGDELEDLVVRHAEYFARLTRHLAAQMLTDQEGAAVLHRGRAHDDIRAAYFWSREHRRIDLITDIVARAAMDVIWHGRIEVAVWASEVVDHVDLSSISLIDRCCLLQTAACLELNEGRADRARDLTAMAEQLSFGLAAEDLPADLVHGSSVCFFVGLLPEGDGIAERLGARLSEVGPSAALAMSLVSRSSIHGYSSRPESALALAQRALPMFGPHDSPTWRTLVDWQIARYSDTDPAELAELLVQFRDRFVEARNLFLAATATRQLLGLQSARETVQSRSLTEAVEGMAKVSLADPREAIGWMMQAAILLMRAGQHYPGLAVIGWERRHRVTPVHPDQLTAIERMMPAARAVLTAEEIEAAYASLTSTKLRDALEYTRQALVEASAMESDAQ